MMMSMSGGWFFVVASEAITVGDKTITLPGIGAYLARARTEKDLVAVGWVVLTMTVVIILYDQLMFRPLVAWAINSASSKLGRRLFPNLGFSIWSSAAAYFARWETLRAGCSAPWRDSALRRCGRQ
jgi:ABC-type anion transport system duplicated permease subunit